MASIAPDPAAAKAPVAVAAVAAPAVAAPAVAALPVPAVAVAAAPVAMTMPVGLAVLQDAAGFYIRQKPQWFEEFTGFEKCNKYDIMLKPKGVTGLQDQQIAALPKVFFAMENSECCERQCFKPDHAFTIDLFDQQRNKILVMDHPNSCCDWTCECFCCGCKVNPTTMVFKTPTQAVVGRSERGYRLFKCTKDTWLDVFDHAGAHRFTFEAACCQFGPNMCCTEYVFHIHEGKDTNTPPVGVLKNVWPGCNAKGLCSKADNLELEWFKDMSIDDKSLLLGAAFHIDFMCFEKQDDDDNGAPESVGPTA